MKEIRISISRRINTAVSCGQQKFRRILIYSPDGDPLPCGACRQVLAEFCGDDFPVVLATPARSNISPWPNCFLTHSGHYDRICHRKLKGGIPGIFSVSLTSIKQLCYHIGYYCAVFCYQFIYCCYRTVYYPCTIFDTLSACGC